MLLCSRAGSQAITSNVILAAATNSQPGRMGLVTPTHTIPRGQNVKASPVFKNKNRLFRRSWHIGPSCNFYFTAGEPCNDKRPTSFQLVWGITKNAQKQCSLKLLRHRDWAWKQGSNFLQYLLAQAPNVDVGKILNQAAETTTCAMMKMLLERTDSVSSLTLGCAAKNELHGAEITEMLLLRHPKLKIGDNAFLHAVQNLNQGSDISHSLVSHLKRPPSQHLISRGAASLLFIDERRLERLTTRSDLNSREILECSAVNEQNGFDLWSALVKTSPKDIDHNFVKKALQNVFHAPRIIDSIIFCGEYAKVSSNVLVAAAAHPAFAPSLLARLLPLHHVDPSTTMSEILTSAAGNEGTGLEAITCLIDVFGDECGVHVNFSVLQRAVKNRIYGSQIVRNLLTSFRTQSKKQIEQFRRLIVAAVENEGQGDTILEILMEEAPTDTQAHTEDDVFTAAARNAACGFKIMVLLIEFYQTTTFPLSTWIEACKNGIEGPGIVDLMLKTAVDRSFINEELFQAAACNESGGLKILKSLLSEASTLVFTDFLATINQYCAESPITDEIIAMVAQVNGPLPFIHLHIDTLSRLEVDTVHQLCRKAEKCMISDAKSEKFFLLGVKEGSSQVGIPVQKALLEDKNIYMTTPVLEHFAQYCNMEVFSLLAKRHDIAKLFPAVSRNHVYGEQIFRSYLGNNVLANNSQPLIFAIRQQNRALLESLVCQASQDSVCEAIVHAAADFQMLQCLLNKVEHLEVTEELLIAACPDVACLRLLLDVQQDRNPEITENLLLAAIKEATKPDSFVLLRDRSRIPVITESLIVSAIEKAEALGDKALEQLVESMTPTHLSRTVVAKAATKSSVLKLLKGKFDKLPPYEQALESAAPDWRRVQLLWENKQDWSMGSIIAPAVAAHEDSWKWLEAQTAAKGEPRIEVTEGMLKSAMQNPNQLRILLSQYEKPFCSQNLLVEACINGLSTLEIIQQHFSIRDFSGHINKILSQNIKPEVLSKILGTTSRPSVVHGLLEPLSWVPSPEERRTRLEILLSRVQWVLPARFLPLAFTCSPTIFQNMLNANRGAFTTDTLMKSLMEFCRPPNMEVALFRQLSDISARFFSRNFLTVIDGYRHLVTEELVFHALLCGPTPFKIIHTIVRDYLQSRDCSAEQWHFLVEVAAQAQGNGPETLRLLLKILDSKIPKKTWVPVKKRIKRLLIGDRRTRFRLPKKIYATAGKPDDGFNTQVKTHTRSSKHVVQVEDIKGGSTVTTRELTGDWTGDEGDSGYGSEPLVVHI